MRESEYRPPEPPLSEAVARVGRSDSHDILRANESKDAKLALALERLDGGVEALLKDPSSYFRVMARFHTYSLANTMMIFAQKPDATHVAGYRQWSEKFGRQVQKGEKGIKIFYPRFRKEIDEETGEEEQRLSGFGVGSVFDVASTEGEPLPKPPSVTSDVSTNDVATAVNLKLSRWCIDQGLTMESIPMNGHKHGFYAPHENKIAIRLTPSVDALSVGKTKTLAHEASHYLAEHKAGIDREDAETVAEASAFVAMSHFDLDTSDYSFHYIAAWAQDRERLHTNLAEIRRVGGGIIDAVEGIGDPYYDDYGSWEQRGEGPLGKAWRELDEETDQNASNF